MIEEDGQQVADAPVRVVALDLYPRVAEPAEPARMFRPFAQLGEIGLMGLPQGHDLRYGLK